MTLVSGPSPRVRVTSRGSSVRRPANARVPSRVADPAPAGRPAGRVGPRRGRRPAAGPRARRPGGPGRPRRGPGRRAGGRSPCPAGAPRGATGLPPLRAGARPPACPTGCRTCRRSARPRPEPSSPGATRTRAGWSSSARSCSCWATRRRPARRLPGRRSAAGLRRTSPPGRASPWSRAPSAAPGLARAAAGLRRARPRQHPDSQLVAVQPGLGGDLPAPGAAGRGGAWERARSPLGADTRLGQDGRGTSSTQLEKQPRIRLNADTRSDRELHRLRTLLNRGLSRACEHAAALREGTPRGAQKPARQVQIGRPPVDAPEGSRSGRHRPMEDRAGGIDFKK